MGHIGFKFAEIEPFIGIKRRWHRGKNALNQHGFIVEPGAALKQAIRLFGIVLFRAEVYVKER